MKIGELVKSHIEKIFHYCETFDQEELERLMGKEYSKKTFNINYPFCKDLSLISDKELVRFWKYDYNVNGKVIRVCSQWVIGNKKYFLNYLLSKKIISDKENLNFKEIVQHTPEIKTPGSIIINTPKDDYANLTDINVELRNEALEMSKNYELFYGVEKSIRMLVVEVMRSNYGENWWESKVDYRVKENVARNLEYELDTPHTKRSEHKIDYATFGDLRKIINTNWNVFESKFKRSLKSVNDVMIDLNRIRVPIAHCTPMASKEIKRLEIRVDDWFDLLKK